MKKSQNPELVHFLSEDKLRLPGLLYEPKAKSDTVAIYIHGCGSASVFYKPEMNLYAGYLTSNNISFFPFNNRGAHYIKTLKRQNEEEEEEEEEERVLMGTTYETIEEAIFDIGGAISMLQSRGYRTFFLIGESTGANKIVLYDYLRHENPITGYVLLSGGDDTGLYFGQLGERRFRDALKKARLMVDKDQGMKIVPKEISAYPLSYQSLYDILDPQGNYNLFPFHEVFSQKRLSSKPLFHEYSLIEKPMLILYGAQDEFCYGNVEGCVAAMKKYSKSKKATYDIIPETGHGFEGKEVELIEKITAWITSNLH